MFTLALLLAAASPVAGEVLTYIRSDTDGAEAETVVIYDHAPGEVWVHKSRTQCTNAAFVVGHLDPATGQALRLVGGRLTRELDQEPFAWLAREGDGVIRARLGNENAPPIFEVAVGDRWVLYDFDFSDIIAHPPKEIAAQRDFSFDLPLLLVGDDQPTFENLGRLELRFVGAGEVDGRRFSHYTATGEALKGGEGLFWFGEDGRLIDAIMPIPNHSEYRDFRLRRVATEQGEEAWRERLARHWQDCPASD
ncbi:MAG: hypothetical protein R3E14_06140 [Erythrobacter sp.]